MAITLKNLKSKLPGSTINVWPRPTIMFLGDINSTRVKIFFPSFPLYHRSKNLYTNYITFHFHMTKLDLNAINKQERPHN